MVMGRCKGVEEETKERERKKKNLYHKTFRFAAFVNRIFLS
jgi:hypothetical protein